MSSSVEEYSDNVEEDDEDEFDGQDEEESYGSAMMVAAGSSESKTSTSPAMINLPSPTSSDPLIDLGSASSTSEQNGSHPSVYTTGMSERRQKRRYVRRKETPRERKRHGPRTKDLNAPRLPLNGYVRFLNAHRERVKKQHPELIFADVTKKLAAEWSALDPEIKQKYLDDAEKDRQIYLKKLKEYRQSDRYKKFMEMKQKQKVENYNKNFMNNQQMQIYQQQQQVQSSSSSTPSTPVQTQQQYHHPHSQQQQTQHSQHYIHQPGPSMQHYQHIQPQQFHGQPTQSQQYIHDPLTSSSYVEYNDNENMVNSRSSTETSTSAATAHHSHLTTTITVSHDDFSSPQSSRYSNQMTYQRQRSIQDQMNMQQQQRSNYNGANQQLMAEQQQQIMEQQHSYSEHYQQQNCYEQMNHQQHEHEFQNQPMMMEHQQQQMSHQNSQLLMGSCNKTMMNNQMQMSSSMAINNGHHNQSQQDQQPQTCHMLLVPSKNNQMHQCKCEMIGNEPCQHFLDFENKTNGKTTTMTIAATTERNGTSTTTSLVEMLKQAEQDSVIDLPIFTEEFLQHNKMREQDLRTIRSFTVDYEEANAICEKHIDDMNKAKEKLQSEQQKEKEINSRLTDIYTDVQNTLMENFKRHCLRIPKELIENQDERELECGPVTLENLDQFMLTLGKVKKYLDSSSEIKQTHLKDSFINSVRQVLASIDETIINSQ